MKTPLLVRFEPDVKEKLKARAKKRGISEAEIVRQLVDAYFA